MTPNRDYLSLAERDETRRDERLPLAEQLALASLSIGEQFK